MVGSLVGPSKHLNYVYMSSAQVCRGFLQRYSNLVTQALKIGLSKKDLRKMVNQRDFFSFETHKSIKLRKTLEKIQELECRLRSRFEKENSETQKSFQRTLRQILRQKIRCRKNFWNPAIVGENGVSLEGLADFREVPFELIIYVIPSPFGFHWETPRTAILSLRNYFTLFKHHSIGHMAIELRKNGLSHAITGMTGETNWQIFERLRNSKIGLEFLFSTYPGRLEEAQELASDIKIHSQWRRIAYIRMPLTATQFSEKLKFLDDWVEMGKYQRYGLVQDPVETRGASCTSFAVHFLRLAGELSPQLEQECSRVIRIPISFIGVKTRNLLSELLFGKHVHRWANENEPHRKLRFWDPDQFYKWVEKRATERFGHTGIGLSLGEKSDAPLDSTP